MRKQAHVFAQLLPTLHKIQSKMGLGSIKPFDNSRNDTVLKTQEFWARLESEHFYLFTQNKYCFSQTNEQMRTDNFKGLKPCL